MVGEGDTFYSVLGVDRTCSPTELKQAYRRLILKYHPDKGTGNEEKFHAVERAYKVLSDPVSRAEYDVELDNAARLEHAVWQVVTLDELERIDSHFTMDCRCGWPIEIDCTVADQLPAIVQCADCSTLVRVNAAC